MKISNYCFCTLALGKQYRKFATDLVIDLADYSDQKNIIIFTDKPSDFKNFKNVILFKHAAKSVHAYFDKSYVIKKSLQLFEACIFLDADVRITGNVPKSINFGQGIKSYSCFKLTQLYGEGFHSENSRKEKHWKLIEKTAEKVDACPEEAKFIWEYCLYITRHKNVFNMLDSWKKLGKYYELNGRIGGEGEALGLAAQAWEVPVDYDYEKVLPFFKNRVELWKISQGKSTKEEMQVYFDRYHEIKYPRKSSLIKAIDKVYYHAKVSIRKIKLIINTLWEPKFYYF